MIATRLPASGVGSISASRTFSIISVRPEPVEGLPFYSRQANKKNGPSTGSGRTDFESNIYQNCQRAVERLTFERIFEAGPLGRRLVGEPGILPLGILPRRPLAC